MNCRAAKLPFGEVNQIGPQMKRIDVQPIAFLPELLLEPIGESRDVGGIVADGQRGSVTLDTQAIEKLRGQLVRYAAAAASFLMFLHFG